jgi:hypothetical protein
MLYALRRSIDVDFVVDTHVEFALKTTPYITSIDLEGESFILYNPQEKIFSLKDYFVSDGKKLHTFKFPDTAEVAALSEVTVYTCPGRTHGNATFVPPYILWTNSDGKLRRKEVLNNEFCSIQLYCPEGKCIATCEAKRDHEPIVKRRHEEYHELANWTLSEPQRMRLSQARICVLIVMALNAVSSPVWCRVCYFLALCCNLASRNRDGSDQLDLSICYIAGDRLCSMILYGAVIASLFFNQCADSHNDSSSGLLNKYWLLEPSLWFIIPCFVLDFISNFIYLMKQVCGCTCIVKSLPTRALCYRTNTATVFMPS